MKARWAVYLSSGRSESRACSLGCVWKTAFAFTESRFTAIFALVRCSSIGLSDGASSSSARPLAVYRAVRPVRWM